MSVFIIAECGSSWRFGTDHLANAYRMIEAAKECGADAVKFQWTSDGDGMAIRRKMSAEAGAMYGYYLQYPAAWLALLKAHAVKVGIQFGVTVFLPQDLEVIAHMVDFFKVSAFEVADDKLRNGIMFLRRVSPFYLGKERRVFVSTNTHGHHWANVELLHCVSKYPCPIDEIRLSRVSGDDVQFSGLSDHSGHTLTGAVAVGAGATVLEVHFKLEDTPPSNPDWPHSHFPASLNRYIGNARIAERML
jgi:sialic acid synthase SpsE